MLKRLWHFEVPTNSSGVRYPGLDLLRISAIVPVVGLHLFGWMQVMSPYLYELFHRGHWGVDIFFVLSGYLIGKPLEKMRLKGDIKLVQFWVRRFTRTILPYLIFLFALVCFGATGFKAIPDDRSVVPYLFYVQNYAWVDNAPALVHFWSLSVEELAYVLLPLILLAEMKIVTPWLRALLVVVVLAFSPLAVWANWESDATALYRHLHLYFQPHYRLFGVFLGWYLARCEVRIDSKEHAVWTWMQRYDRILFWVAFGAAQPFFFKSEAFFHTHKWHTLTHEVLFCIVVACMIPYFAREKKTVQDMTKTQKVLAVVADRVYAIYLIHIPVLQFVAQRVRESWMFPRSWPEVDRTAVATILITAILVFLWRPVEVFSHWVGNRLLAPASPSTSTAPVLPHSVRV